MTFDAILAQIIDLLKRQGRVSYSALKRRFDLDDDYLNDLKDELLFSHPVVDADNRGLVWAGNIEGTIDTPAPPLQTIPAPPTQDQPSAQQASPTAEAERRQLTVMFCDLVESTQLSGKLDPEDLRDIVRAYQRVCSEVITRFDGHIAQLLGDGLLVYFGYPVAHEDDAQRAIRDGLGMLAAMGDLNKGLQQAKKIQLALRIGVHTGLVVIGEMGEAGRQEQLALGEVPNIGSRIEGLAAPNTIAVSEATYRLVQGYFACEALGEQTLRGVAEPVPVYRVLQENGAKGRLDVAVTRGLTPLVGRESEVTLLLERWEQAKSGQGHVVLLSGDAGIGKSRLVQMLKEHVAHEPHTRWECRSSPYFEHTALFPVTDLFQRLFQFHAEDTPDTKLEKLASALSPYRLPVEETIPLFAPLLSLPLPENRYPLLNLSPQRQRQKTLETIVALLQEHATRHPVLFIVEDLHWADPTTLELLNLLIEQIPTTSMLTALTCRPTFQPNWSHRSYLSEVTVQRLSRTQVEQIVTRITEGKTFPSEVLTQIVEKTDGVPLFVEEMTKAIFESGHLKEVDGDYHLTGSLPLIAIPATLQDALMARLDRLVTAKAVAQYASVIGRQFSYALLQHVSQLDGPTLQRELGRLVEAEMVYQRGVPPQSTYVFKHALIQDAAYASLLKSTRQQYHQRIAQVLESQFPETAQAQPELLAHHYTEAELKEQAVSYWHKAGERAMERSAFVEAIVHCTKGLEVLQRLPVTRTRAQDELTLHIALGSALQMIQGFAAPEVERVYTRAYALCEQVGEPTQHIQVLLGLRAFYHVKGDLQTAWQIGQQLLPLLEQVHDPILIMQVCYAVGHTLYFRGAFAAAREHLERGSALQYSLQHRSLAIRRSKLILSVPLLAWTLWYLGYPDQALVHMQTALAWMQEVVHPPNVEYVLSSAAILRQLRGEGKRAHEYIERAIAVATEQGFQFRRAWNVALRGWIL